MRNNNNYNNKHNTGELCLAHILILYFNKPTSILFKY